MCTCCGTRVDNKHNLTQMVHGHAGVDNLLDAENAADAATDLLSSHEGDGGGGMVVGLLIIKRLLRALRALSEVPPPPPPSGTQSNASCTRKVISYS